MKTASKPSTETSGEDAGLRGALSSSVAGCCIPQGGTVPSVGQGHWDAGVARRGPGPTWQWGAHRRPASRWVPTAAGAGCAKVRKGLPSRHTTSARAPIPAERHSELSPNLLGPPHFTTSGGAPPKCRLPATSALLATRQTPRFGTDVSRFLRSRSFGNCLFPVAGCVE